MLRVATDVQKVGAAKRKDDLKNTAGTNQKGLRVHTKPRCDEDDGEHSHGEVTCGHGKVFRARKIIETAPPYLHTTLAGGHSKPV